MTEYDEWDDIYGEDNELEGFGCVLGDECMMPSPFHFPSECHTAGDLDDLGANCPTCGVAITTSNAGGYRAYCEKCAEDAVNDEAQS